jgi:glycosyltransferase involved in cell wall biosynthesis
MGARPTKVLFVCHNHPTVRPGGAEQYALELYEALRERPEYEPYFLAWTAPLEPALSPRHSHAVITSVNDDPNQYFIHTDHKNWHWLFERRRDKEVLTRCYADFLRSIRPDVVHFQHTLFIGYDALRVTRNMLPEAPIVYTLHDFIPICHHHGQMVRTFGNKLCDRASPRRCHECFPHVSAPEFFMRERFIKSQLALVDRFITPSRILRRRYSEWGLPAEQILFEDYGRRPVAPTVEAPDSDLDAGDHADRPRNRFAFFGQFTPFKGTDVLLEAMAALGDDFDGHLWIHGANLEVQSQEFQDRFKPLLEETAETVTVAGSYNRARLAKLMARVDWVVVPSIWWENSPLVIQEAFLHGRPVICSDIGGMAEKVDDEVNGLHFRRADPDHLAQVMARAAGTPGLWERLRAGIPPIHGMDDHVARLTALYSELMDDTSGARTAPLAAAPGS